MQGAQSSRGVSLCTPFAGGTPVATGVGDAVGLSPSSPPNTGHSIHVFYRLPPRLPSSVLFVGVTPSVLPLSQNCHSFASPPRLLPRSLCTPRLHPSSWGTMSFRGRCLWGTHVTARAVTTLVAGKLRSSADVASPRLDVDDDVDVHARSPARDAGTYHGIGPKRISDVRQLQLKFEISIG